MTKPNDPIERALDRLTLAEAPRRTILTDLVAEAINKERLETLGVKASLEHEVDRRKVAEARLAAVVERAERNASQAGWDESVDLAEDIIAIARGEGGEQADGFGKGAEKPSQEGEPAAPPAAPDAETKPQQSPASDGDLAEIVRDACEELGVSKTWPAWDAHLNVIAAACIRARETDQRRSFTTVDGMVENIALRDKLAAVREWAVRWIALLAGHRAKIELDAILDGEKGNDDERTS